MASSPGLNFLIAKYLRGLPNSNLANVKNKQFLINSNHFFKNFLSRNLFKLLRKIM
jgi:hypothetical protein